jgi:transketolase|tara:strand:+ start:913 stop:1542 length:630 start_codon:yes stop_codon:yes gene_type:complete
MNNQLSRSILEASFKAEACHIGSALSCVKIVEDIFKRKRKKDVFLFGKASGVATLYCKLHGDKAWKYLKRYPLPHKKVPGVTWSLGSVGHGLPVAVGMAMGDRTRNVYVLLSDGDVQAGTFWESILFARQHKLRNLKIYIDRNRLQSLGDTEEILGIDKALKLMKQLFPIKVVETIKGQGVDFLEGKVESHYINLDKHGLEEALLQLLD